MDADDPPPMVTELTRQWEALLALPKLPSTKRSDNGGTLCWQVSGEPDSWHIVCLDGKLSERYDRFDMTLTGFLAAWLSQEISPRTFAPDFFPIPRPAFKPYSTQ